MRRKLVTAAGIVLAGAAGLGGTAGPAAAQSEEEVEAREIAAVGTAKVGLAEAIAAAEKQLGGTLLHGSVWIAPRGRVT